MIPNYELTNAANNGIPKLMITAIVIYKLPSTIDRADCQRHFEKITKNFRDVPGLIRKQFIWNESGDAGGVYLWENLAAARAFYSGPWLNGIIERYNAYPKITYFDTMAMTDNTTNEIKIFDEQKNK